MVALLIDITGKAFLKLPPLEIKIQKTGKVLRPRVPFILGGAGLGITDGVLAGYAAKAGMIGILSGTLRTHDIVNEIKKARDIAGPEGILGVNMLGVMSDFKEAMELVMPHIDVFTQGAKFLREPFKLCAEHGVAFLPIISNPKSIPLCEKLGAAAIVIESGQGGGHQGTTMSTWEMAKMPEVKEAKVPTIAAGGIMDGEEAAKLITLGYSGVQMTTVFILTKECTVAEKFKRRYFKAKKEDIIRFMSPAGLPGMALRDPFLEPYYIEGGNQPDKTVNVAEKQCNNCLIHCNKTFCLRSVLWGAYYKGEKLIFCGGNVHRLKEKVPDFNNLPTVEEVVRRIENEAVEYLNSRQEANGYLTTSTVQGA
jgi:NAD(P)H-dependent flavin oxidoreductase YrpB (nitropropane dioxygenase family)